MAYTIYDYIDRRGINVMQEWARGLTKVQKAKLNQKVDLLSQHGDNLSTDLLSDTPSRQIKKLRVHGDVAFRPLLCRGPLDTSTEFTFLLGATEKDRKLAPEDLRKAEDRRMEVNQDSTRRVKHERF